MPDQNDGWERRTFKNSILRRLPSEAIERLRLYPVELGVPGQLESPAASVRSLVFVENGVASITTTLLNGSQGEAGLYGYGSVIGISALLGTKPSFGSVDMQIAGSGFMSNIADGRAEFQRGEHFQGLALASVQAQLVQLAQLAACNAKHSINQRLARWLLTCSDLSGTTELILTQDSIAGTLGVRRMSANNAIGELKINGMIEHHRKAIKLVNRHALRTVACECYDVIQGQLEMAFAHLDSNVADRAKAGLRTAASC